MSRWWTLGLIHFSILAFAMTLQLIPPLLPSFVAQFGMTHGQAGLLMALFTLPGIFLALPGGYLADIFGARKIGMISLLLLAAGTLSMALGNTVFLFLGRFISGIGAGSLIVVAPQVISQRFVGREIGLAMGIFNTAVPLGTIIAFNLMVPITQTLGVLAAITLTAVFDLIAFAVFFFTFPDQPSDHDTGPVARGRRGIRGLGRGIWIATAVWTLFNMALMSFFTYGIDLFTLSGYGPNYSALLASIPMIISIPLAPFAGMALDRYGWRTGPLILGGIVSAIAIFFIAYYPHLALIETIFLGVAISFFPPAIFTIAGEVLPRERMGTGFGVFTSIYNLGFFAAIPLLGAMKDSFGVYGPSFTVMAVLLLMSSCLSFLLRK
ncbi:MAG: MFS transporter [Deltaproteobacteria bacterium]|nr:MFS transporter [Deltaproteobacteria bacterium]